MHKSGRRSAIVFALLVFFFTPVVSFSQVAQRNESVLIKTPKPYTTIVARVRALGGYVKHQYKYIDAIAADVPENSLVALRSLAGPNAVSRDMLLAPPHRANPEKGRNLALSKSLPRNTRAKSVTISPSIPSSDGDPYILNAAGLNLQNLHKQGWTGAGIVVAVIDTGIRPEYPIKGSVVGCENLMDDNRDGQVDRRDGKCMDTANNPHGTFVAGLIAGQYEEFHIKGTELLASLKQNLPAALKKDASGEKTILPLIGSAPGARIYAFRAFDFDSTIIDAIDRVIELRESGVNIKVCNISIGGYTLFAGRDNLDRAVDALLDHDIVPVIAAGDAGRSSLTIASPASSFSALSVGAISPAANERIVWDMNPLFCRDGVSLCKGLQNRASTGTQVASTSSRGPTADGRSAPHVVATGFGNFGQGFSSPNDIDLEFGGTSYSSPTVAGAAAVLRQAHPWNTARQIRNAIISSANPRLIDDGSGELDRGAGVVDATAAHTLLDGGRVPDFLARSAEPSLSVEDNIERGTNLKVLRGSVRQSERNLKPGQRAEILYEITDRTDQVVISISNLSVSAAQNPVWHDDVVVGVHSAKTSQIAGLDPSDPTVALFGDYYFFYPTFGETITIDDPEPGIMRITIAGDSFNGGIVSADVSVTSTQEPFPPFTARGEITDQGTIRFPVAIPNGVTRADFQLRWSDDWSRYPTSDIKFMTILDPGGTSADFVSQPVPHADPFFPDVKPGLDAPQTVSVEAQRGKTLKNGTWYLDAFGFEVPALTDNVELLVTVDGKPLK